MFNCKHFVKIRVILGLSSAEVIKLFYKSYSCYRFCNSCKTF